MSYNPMYSLYQLTTLDGRRYVGVTKDMRRRRAAHRRRLGDVVIRVLVVGTRDYIYGALSGRLYGVLDTRHPNQLNVADGGYGSRDFLPITKAKLGRVHARESIDEEIGARHLRTRQN